MHWNSSILFMKLKTVKMVVEITKNNFEEIVLMTDKPVLLDFYATWCGPCKLLHPTMNKLAVEFEGKVIIARVDVDLNKDLTIKYQVVNIPVVVIQQNENRIDKIVGVCPLSTYANVLNKLI